MIDENFKVYLIECNTNPSLEICCPLLARIIPELLDNSFRLAIDPIYQPAFIIEEKIPQVEAQNLKKNEITDDLTKRAKQRRRLELISHIKYTLIFDELVDGDEL